MKTDDQGARRAHDGAIAGPPVPRRAFLGLLAAIVASPFVPKSDPWVGVDLARPGVDSYSYTYTVTGRPDDCRLVTKEVVARLFNVPVELLEEGA